MLTRIRQSPRVRRALRFGLALQIATLQGLGCAANPSAPEPVAPGGTPISAGTVLVVDQAGFDDLRNSGKYDISASLGDVGATAACESGSADEKCVEAAHERLKGEAQERGANLVVVLNTALLQSFPVRYSVNAQLYKATERR
jgi:hypothetical protein